MSVLGIVTESQAPSQLVFVENANLYFLTAEQPQKLRWMDLCLS